VRIVVAILMCVWSCMYGKEEERKLTTIV